MRILLLILLLTLGAWGQETRSFLAIRTRDGAVIAQQDPDRLLVPASSLKILTAARALQLDPFETTLWYENGLLTMRGGGDPTLTRADVEAMAREVAAPVTAVQVETPDLGAPYGPGWAWEDMTEDFQPEVCGLTVDGGLTEVTVTPDEIRSEARLRFQRSGGTGPLTLWWLPGRSAITVRGGTEEPLTFKVPVPEPDLWAGSILGPNVTRGRARGTVVARHLSAPIETILKRALAVSDNLVMETLYRQLPAQPQPGRIVDGCGLSRYNLISVRMLVSALGQHPELLKLLPRPGEEGTLKERFRNVPLDLVAKTGTLGGVSALAGALNPGRDEEIVFAVITNGTLDVRATKKWEEDWVSGLAPLR